MDCDFDSCRGPDNVDPADHGQCLNDDFILDHTPHDSDKDKDDDKDASTTCPLPSSDLLCTGYHRTAGFGLT